MRTVLQFDPEGKIDPVTGAEEMRLKAIRAYQEVPGARLSQPFKLAPTELPAWDVPNGVRLRGQLIRERLSGHPGVKELLKQLDQTPVTDINPLYVVLSEGAAELISWETLCNATDEFFALDKRWPIARISDPMAGQSRPPAALRLPVKMMAIISAWKVHGQVKEWEHLRTALLAARAKGLEVCLKLLVGHPDLRKAIDDEIAGGLTGVEVSHIDKTGARVIREIIGWGPNVVHFFCHGIADGGEQSLELATGSDYADPGTNAGTVKIGTKQLVNLSGELTNPWLLTLNCCDSAQAAKDLQSMAHQIVSAGFPAAVAMMEPIDASDAHEFTGAFYSTMFTALAEVKKKLADQPQVPFEWVYAMYAARTAIRDLHGAAEDSREWALPVLYVRGVEPFHFVPPHDIYTPDVTREFKLKARLVAGWLKGMGEDTDEASRLSVMESTLSDVPKEFWPKVDGTFDGSS